MTNPKVPTVDDDERVLEDALRTYHGELLNGLMVRLRRIAARARASKDAKDKVIEQLKADTAGLLLLLTTAERTWSASHDLSDAAHHASMMALRQALTTQLHHGTAILEELTRLRAQVATLITGQQRNGEARQQAFLELAHELAEMDPPARDAAIRRIIDSHEDKP